MEIAWNCSNNLEVKMNPVELMIMEEKSSLYVMYVSIEIYTSCINLTNSCPRCGKYKRGRTLQDLVSDLNHKI